MKQKKQKKGTGDLGQFQIRYWGGGMYKGEWL